MFKCNKIWCTLSDGLAMTAAMGVFLTNLWMRSVEKSLRVPIEGREIKNIDIKGRRLDFNRRVTLPGERVECESNKNRFHAKCQGVINTKYKTLQETECNCSYCAKKGTKEDTLASKFFKRYVKNLVSTVKGILWSNLSVQTLLRKIHS